MDQLNKRLNRLWLMNVVGVVLLLRPQVLLLLLLLNRRHMAVLAAALLQAGCSGRLQAQVGGMGIGSTYTLCGSIKFSGSTGFAKASG